jgi:CheY-like chemotaxis protein
VLNQKIFSFHISNFLNSVIVKLIIEGLTCAFILMPKKEPTENAGIKARRILTIDDNLDSALALKKELENKGLLENDVFSDPYLALQNFKAGLYDILLIDLLMATTSNGELCNRIRKMDKKIKICYISGTYQKYEEVRNALPELEREYFIPKPVAINDLLEKIS